MIEPHVGQVAWQRKRGRPPAQAKRLAGHDRPAQAVGLDLKLHRPTVEINFQTTRPARSVMSDEDVGPRLTRQRRLGHDLEGIARPRVDQVHQQLAVVDQQVETAIGILVVHLAQGGAIAPWPDPGAVRETIGAVQAHAALELDEGAGLSIETNRLALRGVGPRRRRLALEPSFDGLAAWSLEVQAAVKRATQGPVSRFDGLGSGLNVAFPALLASMDRTFGRLASRGRPGDLGLDPRQRLFLDLVGNR